MRKTTQNSWLTAAAQRNAGSGSSPRSVPAGEGEASGLGVVGKGAKTLRGSERSEMCPLSSSFGCFRAEVGLGLVWCLFFFLYEVLGYTYGFQRL